MTSTLTTLQASGWTIIDGVKSDEDFYRISTSIGVPLPSPTGELIKRITPQTSEQSRPGTMSDQYGLEAFPFHTDTAFWPTPARYVLLKAEGDIRRNTCLLSIPDLISKAGIPEKVKSSIWKIRTPQHAFYCSMSFKQSGVGGYRYDPVCMMPANRPACFVRSVVDNLIANSKAQTIQWSPGDVVVLDNWRMLHSRGPAPQNEATRTLARIYVEGNK